MIYRGFKIKIHRVFSFGHVVALEAISLDVTFLTPPRQYFTISECKEFKGVEKIMMSKRVEFRVLIESIFKILKRSIDSHLDGMTDLELWCIEEKACIQDKHDQIAYALESSKALTGKDKQLRLAVADDLLDECNERLTVLNEKMKQI